MAEDWEVDSDHVRKTIEEELEKKGDPLLKRIALTTAVLAALAAVAALYAGDTANAALARKTEATRLQAEASDTWAYYQAKGLKGALQEVTRQVWLANGKPPPTTLAEAEAHYSAEQKELEQHARTLERQRDTKSQEAEQLLHRHHGFAYAVTLFQVSIALGAVAALTQTRMVWAGSLLVGGGGLVLFLHQLFHG